MRPCLSSITRTQSRRLWQSTLGCNYFQHSQCNSLLVIVGIRNDFKKPRRLMLNSHMPQYEDCILRIIKVIKIDKVLLWVETEEAISTNAEFVLYIFKSISTPWHIDLKQWWLFSNRGQRLSCWKHYPIHNFKVEIVHLWLAILKET